MWGALLAVYLTAWLHDRHGTTRTGIIRLRRELINVPARLIGHARALTLRLAPPATTCYPASSPGSAPTPPHPT